MEEIFPLTDQVNLLSETSRYALDNLLATHLSYNGTKSIIAKPSNSNTKLDNTCYNDNTCSPLPSKRLQHESLRRQSSKGKSRSGIWFDEKFTNKTFQKNQEQLTSYPPSYLPTTIYIHVIKQYQNLLDVSHTNSPTTQNSPSAAPETFQTNMKMFQMNI